jgi:membrane protease YdiL (CAAX protease family)
VAEAALLVMLAWRARRAATPGSADDLAEWRASLVRWPATRAGRWLTFASPFGFHAVALLAVAAAPGELDWTRLANGPLATPAGLIELLVVGALLQSLGEEPGWRGWFLPKLRERLGPFAATLVLFPVWLFWHLPMFLARPEFGLPQFGGFALGILSAAVWMTAIYELTKSTLAAIAWHLLINATRGVALAISTPAFLSYGMAVTLGAVAIAVVAWRRSRSS